jgi:hypothetical protein
MLKINQGAGLYHGNCFCTLYCVSRAGAMGAWAVVVSAVSLHISLPCYKCELVQVDLKIPIDKKLEDNALPYKFAMHSTPPQSVASFVATNSLKAVLSTHL